MSFQQHGLVARHQGWMTTILKHHGLIIFLFYCVRACSLDGYLSFFLKDLSIYSIVAWWALILKHHSSAHPLQHHGMVTSLFTPFFFWIITSWHLNILQHFILIDWFWWSFFFAAPKLADISIREHQNLTHSLHESTIAHQPLYIHILQHPR